MGICWVLWFWKSSSAHGCSEMAAYSVQRASHKSGTHRLRADLGQSRIRHSHGHAEHRDLDSGIRKAMPFETSNNRNQASDGKEDQAVGITQFGLTKEVCRETTGDKA
jgi:hypothetical protein